MVHRRLVISHLAFRRFWHLPGLLIYFAVFPLAAPAALQALLSDHVPPAVASMRAVGQLPATESLELVVGLPLRNPDELKQLLDDIYNPASPQFRHYLTPEEFTRRFGPSEADYRTLIDFVESNHLFVRGTHPNRTLLDIRGQAADIERLLHVNLRVYQHDVENRLFFAPDREPSVDLPIRLLHIGGLDNYRLPRPKLRPNVPEAASGIPQPKVGSGLGGSFMGYDFRAAYVPGVSLTGAGQSIGLVEFGGYYSNDIVAYELQAGLPPTVLTNVLLEGYGGEPAGGNGSIEVPLDIEMSIAMAPGLSQVIVYEDNPTGFGNDILNRMATDNLARQLSSSWNFGTDASSDVIFQELAAQGQTFFDAAGDVGAYAGSVPTPDDDPYITIVGGTSLSSTGPRGGRVSESVWQSGSGGRSTTYPIPYWQQPVNMAANQGSATYRNIPDVALVAANIQVNYNNGASNAYSGTSYSAPLWAGFMALVNQQAAQNGQPPVGFLNPALYWLGQGSNYSVCFNDITNGNNTNASSPDAYFAVPGYDLCTGWGTPAGSNLITALAIPEPLRIGPGSGLSGTGPEGGPFNLAIQNLTLTNISSVPLSWACGTTSVWLNVSPNSGALPPGKTATLSLTITPSADSLAATQYVANLWFTNLTDGLLQNRQLTLQVWSSLIQNGGFESANFSGWNQSGNTGSTFVGLAPYVYTGEYGAQLGAGGSLGYLSQTVPTVTGQAYLLSLWLYSPDGKYPNEFRVSWNSQVLFDQTNIGPIDWTNLAYVTQATGTTSVVQLGFRDDPSYLGLDDVSLLAVPLPAFQVPVKAGTNWLLSWTCQPGFRYQLQSRSDLAQGAWSNAAILYEATKQTGAVLVPPGNNAHQFFRLQMLP